ncbi:hypothetical protein YC2023_060021 [Brassica napus]
MWVHTKPQEIVTRLPPLGCLAYHIKEEGMMCPDSTAETNQEGLAYGSGLNEMGFMIYEKYVYKHVSAQRKKTQQENTSHERIIYQSDDNSEIIDHAKGHDQPKSFATTNSQIREILMFVPSGTF